MSALAIRLTPEQLDELAERIAERLREPDDDRWLDTRGPRATWTCTR
jgi:hypothetical protein